MTRPTRVVIDLGALRHNLRRVRQSAPGARVMAIVKANAYGHGMARVARALAPGVDGFGVACLGEAAALREAGISAPITLLEGVFEPREYDVAAHLGLAVVVHHAWQLEALTAARLPDPLTVWVKVDSGMHRLGLPPSQVRRDWERLADCPSVVKPMGLMTHFAAADERDSPATARQLDCFREAVRGLPGARCLANSAAILAWPETHGDWVRPGLMLYGASPLAGGTAREADLRPVMTFGSRLIAVNTFRSGDALGYGGTWVCPETMRVGVVAAGYADGYPRHAPSGTPVLIDGRRAPLVGRVSMDMLCVDLRGHPLAQVGDSVVLWGEGLPVDEIAAAAGTIAYELLCHVAPRVAVVERP